MRPHRAVSSPKHAGRTAEKHRRKRRPRESSPRTLHVAGAEVHGSNARRNDQVAHVPPHHSCRCYRSLSACLSVRRRRNGIPNRGSAGRETQALRTKSNPYRFLDLRKTRRRNALEALAAEARWNSDDPSRRSPRFCANRAIAEARREALRARSYKASKAIKRRQRKQARRNLRNSTRSRKTMREELNRLVHDDELEEPFDHMLLHMDTTASTTSLPSES